MHGELEAAKIMKYGWLHVQHNWKGRKAHKNGHRHSDIHTHPQSVQPEIWGNANRQKDLAITQNAWAVAEYFIHAPVPLKINTTHRKIGHVQLELFEDVSS